MSLRAWVGEREAHQELGKWVLRLGAGLNCGNEVETFKKLYGIRALVH